MANQGNTLHDDMVRALAGFARKHTTEAPWYGPLNILLSQQLNMMDVLSFKLMAVVPQLPLAVGTIGNEDDMFDPPVIQEESPDPLSLTYSPPVNLDWQGVKNKPQFTEDEFQDFYSTRIPDFVRMRFYNYNTHNIRHRIDLLVEVKRPPRDPTERGRLRQTVKMQVYEQAYHAFHPDSHLHTLGCLIVMGNEWEYTDIERAPTMAHSRMSRRDLTYAPSEASADGSSDSGFTESQRPQTPPHQIFHIPPPPLAPVTMQSIPNGFVSFLHPQIALVQQQTMLRLIHEHLEDIDQTMIHSYTQG